MTTSASGGSMKIGNICGDRRCNVCFAFAHIILLLNIIPAVGATPTIGWVAVGTNTMLRGQPLIPKSILFSGDTLEVQEGAAEIEMQKGSVFVLGRDTSASFSRTSSEIVVTLVRGNVSIYRPKEADAMKVNLNNISCVTEKGYRTRAEVALINGSIVVTTKEGLMRVRGKDREFELSKGNTIVVGNVPTASPAPQAGGAAIAKPPVSTVPQILIPRITLGAGLTAVVLVAAAISSSNSAEVSSSQAAASFQGAGTSTGAISFSNSAEVSSSQAAASSQSASIAYSNAANAAATVVKSTANAATSAGQAAIAAADQAANSANSACKSVSPVSPACGP